jgi:hypothetical protein
MGRALRIPLGADTPALSSPGTAAGPLPQGTQLGLHSVEI